MAARPRIGLALPQYERGFPDTPDVDYGRLREIAQQAEGLGFDSLWLSDHFYLARTMPLAGVVECMTTLAALAEATSRARLGTLVVCNSFRHPSLLAKMAATIDQISDGRLDLGIGAGWHEQEFRAFGYDFETAGIRVTRLREASEILRALLGGETVRFKGKYYELHDAVLLPRPVQRPRVPLWIAAASPRTLRITAEFADGWNRVWTSTPAQFRGEVANLREICRQVGRDDREIVKSLGLHVLVGRDGRDLAAQYAQLQKHSTGAALAGMPLDAYREGRIVGTPDEVVAQIRAFADEGLDHLVVNLGAAPFTMANAEQLELFGREVLPRLG